MTKRNLVTMLIVTAVIALISIFANFYRPIDCSIGPKGAYSINLHPDFNNVFQPIFADKKLGVTYTLLANFVTENNNVLKGIYLSTDKISGLGNVFIKKAIYLKKKKEAEQDKIYVELSIGFKKNHKSFPVKLDQSVPIDIDNVEIIVSDVNYQSIFGGNPRGHQHPDCEKDDKLNSEDTIPKDFITDGGRICNIACYHE